MTTYKHSLKVESIEKPYFVWFENNWVHDDILHKHKKAQLIYVDSGFQYLTVADKKYVVPQYHAAWIPSDAMHKTNTHSAYIKLMVLFFDIAVSQPFYEEVVIFLAPPVLREMIRYAEKWSNNPMEQADETIFLGALLHELPNFVAQSLQLHLIVPEDTRLTKAMNYLHANYTGELQIHKLSELAALSVRSLERIFKKQTGLTLIKYQQMLRIIKSLELLSTQTLTISEIAFQVGYKSVQAYHKSFHSLMGSSPSDFLKRMRQP